MQPSLGAHEGIHMAGEEDPERNSETEPVPISVGDAQKASVFMSGSTHQS